MFLTSSFHDKLWKMAILFTDSYNYKSILNLCALTSFIQVTKRISFFLFFLRWFIQSQLQRERFLLDLKEKVQEFGGRIVHWRQRMVEAKYGAVPYGSILRGMAPKGRAHCKLPLRLTTPPPAMPPLRHTSKLRTAIQVSEHKSKHNLIVHYLIVNYDLC